MQTLSNRDALCQFLRICYKEQPQVMVSSRRFCVGSSIAHSWVNLESEVRALFLQQGHGFFWGMHVFFGDAPPDHQKS